MCETILNVSSSLGNNKWIGNSLTEDRQAEFIMQRSDVSLLTATVLALSLKHISEPTRQAERGY